MNKLRIVLSLLLSFSSLVYAQSKALVFCTQSSPEGFDPPVWDTQSTNNVTRNLYQGLMEFKRGALDIEPLLAQSYSISPDNLRYTFTLRPNISFHHTDYFKPQRMFNADDVVFTFQRFLNPKLSFNQGYREEYLAASQAGFRDLIANVTKIDDMTVEFQLKTPNVTFLSILAMPVSSIVSKEYADALSSRQQKDQFNLQPIGTGPFQYHSFRKDAALRLVANENYWRKPQKNKQLIFSIVGDTSVRLHKLKKGECDLIASVPEQFMREIRNDPEIKIAEHEAMNVSYLAYNQHRPQFKEKAVRIALDIAIDRDAIFKTLFPTKGAMQAVNPYPPQVLGYNHHNKNEYNPDKAKALLAQAGYPDGFEIDLWAIPVQSATNPDGRVMAQLIAQDWDKIGVKTNIKSYEWGEYLKRASNGEHDIYMSGFTSDSGDPDDFLYANLSCAVSKNKQRFCDTRFEALLQEGRMTADLKQRAQIYEEALAIFKEERPWITMAHSKSYVPMRQSVQGFVMDPNGGFRFEDVYLQD